MDFNIIYPFTIKKQKERIRNLGINMKNSDHKQKEIQSILFLIAISLYMMAFLFDPVGDVFVGYFRILASPSNLLTDYMEIAGIGPAFFNAFTIMIFSISIIKTAKKNFTGADVAAIVLVTGFAFFGKNLFNSLPLTLGTLLYARLAGLERAQVVTNSLYITALAPLISEVIFDFGLSLPVGIALGYLLGIVIGLVIIPLAHEFFKFHKGYSLYNVGFAAGIFAMLLVAILRMFDLEIETVSFLYEETDPRIISYLVILFASMILYGFVKNGMTFEGYRQIMKSTGRVPSDYIMENGLYPTVINMGVMGLIACLFVYICGGVFNGPVVGGIFSVCGFAAFGKHPRNTIPVLAGVFIAGMFNIHDQSYTSSLLAGLFGTTLSPIAGEFGPIAGIAAGFLHMGMVFNVGIVYGGVNLYNNGFSGGFVAGIMVPIIAEIIQFKDKLKKKLNKDPGPDDKA